MRGPDRWLSSRPHRGLPCSISALMTGLEPAALLVRGATRLEHWLVLALLLALPSGAVGHLAATQESCTPGTPADYLGRKANEFDRTLRPRPTNPSARRARGRRPDRHHRGPVAAHHRRHPAQTSARLTGSA